MSLTRPALCIAAFMTLFATAASAAPAYVVSTVNLRAGPATSNDIVGKIPGGSLVDATDCADGWCSVTWQGKSGFAIQTALDTSGRVPVRRPVAPNGAVAVDDGYVPMGPPAYYYGPPVYYGGGPYYYGYGYGWRGGYGYRGYRRRW